MSLAYALGAGYRFRVRSDGNAIIIRPTGEAYHVYDWTCDCADALFRDGGSYERPSGERVCKHLVWLSQVRPCHISTCEGIMVLVEWKTCFGEVAHYFECPRCGCARDFGLVKQERRQDRQQRAAWVA